MNHAQFTVLSENDRPMQIIVLRTQQSTCTLLETGKLPFFMTVTHPPPNQEPDLATTGALASAIVWSG